MEEGPLLGGMSGPEEAMVPDLFGAGGGFAAESVPLNAAAAGRAEDEELHALPDLYLGPTAPLLRAFDPALGVDCKAKAEAGLLVDGNEEEMLGEFPRLPGLDPQEDAVLPAVPPPQAYNVHFLSPVRTPHGSPAVVPLGAWARDGAAHAGVRVIPVEGKERGGASETPEETALQNPLSQEARMFRLSQEAEGASGVSHKDTSPMVICQLRGGTPMLCIDGSGPGELKALHWVPQDQDQSDSPQSDGPRPVTALVGRLLPVPAKLNLITQQLGNGASPSTVNGSAFPAGPALAGPPKVAVAGCCSCFAGGDFGSSCTCHSCCNNLCHGIERFKAIKAKAMCSSICKCTGCKNHPESPERKALVAVPTCVEGGGTEGGLPRFRAERRSSCISWEVVEATCACLLAQGEEAERAQRPEGLAQQMILEEFGRCLSQILHTEFKSKGLTVE